MSDVEGKEKVGREDFIELRRIIVVPTHRIVPEQEPTSSVVCEILDVIAHHAKFLRGDSKVHSLSSRRLF